MNVRVLPVTITAIVVALAAGVTAAPAIARASAPVTIATVSNPLVALFSGAPAAVFSTLYVDSSGAAHIAYVDPTGESIDLCTIPAGGTACIDRSTLTTAISGVQSDFAPNTYIDWIEYLPTGDGTDYLAVGLSGLEPASFDGLEVYPPGQTTGIETGVLDPGQGEGSGLPNSVILEPDDSGVDVVGSGNDTGLTLPPGENLPQVINAYEFQPFQGAASAPNYMGATASCTSDDVCSAYPDAFAVTKLPQGQTGVLVHTGPAGPYVGAPVGMAVQPAAGGAFSPVRSLGLSGAVLTTFASSADTYLLNVGAGKAVEGAIHQAPLHLDRFRATNLLPVATVGETDVTLAHSEVTTFEDPLGDLAVAWLNISGEDDCPGAPLSDTSNRYDVCVMYRRVAAGGLLGPKVVLAATPSETFGDDGLGPVSVNPHGAGWVLLGKGLETNNGTGTNRFTLVAEPLVSSATAGAATVSGSALKAPVSCAGSPSTSCVLHGSLGGGGGGGGEKEQDPGLAAAARARTSGYADITKRIKGGAKATLELRLDKAGRTLLARKHRLTVKLLITETIGAVKTPTTVVSQNVTFGKARKHKHSRA